MEEGEGLGPRKELFELAARQLSAKWRYAALTPFKKVSFICAACPVCNAHDRRADVDDSIKYTLYTRIPGIYVYVYILKYRYIYEVFIYL